MASTASSPNSFLIFDGNDFNTWKKITELNLKAEGFIKYITEPLSDDKKATDDMKDVKVRACLIKSLKPEVQRKIINCDSAYEMWKRLLTIYESNNPLNIVRILKEFFAYKMCPGDGIDTHVSKIEDMAAKLHQLDAPQAEIIIIAKILDGLPQEYNSFETAWDSVSPERRTKQELIDRLRKEEMRLKSESSSYSEVLLTTKETTKDNQYQRLERKNFKSEEDFRAAIRRRTTCRNCQRKGHIASQCRVRKTHHKPDEQECVALIATSSAYLSENESEHESWLIDSGANRHICRNKCLFHTFSPEMSFIVTGNKSTTPVLGTGTVKIDCLVNNKTTTISLSKVLFAPAFTKNLISLGEADKNGVSTTFRDGKCFLSIKNKTFAEATKAPGSGLYKLKGKAIANEAHLVQIERSIDGWHQTMGHADSNNLKRMAKNNIAEGMRITNQQQTSCEVCPPAKGSRAPHPSIVRTSTEDVGELVEIDLVGPFSQASLGNKKYAMITKDNFSDYSHVMLLQNKEESAAKLQEYIGVFESQCGRPIRKIRSDNGSEFVNSKVKTVLAVEHILHETSAPYQPQQNGAAERNNRTLIETTRANLRNFKLDKRLWSEALATAVFLRNRIAKKNKDKTPFEIFYGRKPYLGHLCQFGTPVHVIVNDRRLGKLDNRTEAGCVIGFTSRRNTYRVFLNEKQRVKESCDVIFQKNAHIPVCKMYRKCRKNPNTYTSESLMAQSLMSHLNPIMELHKTKLRQGTAETMLTRSKGPT